MEEKKEKVFVDGMIFKTPDENTKEKAPWIKGKISFKADEFIAFLQKHKSETGWVNVDLKKSKEKGTLYLELNTWKPKNNLDKVDYPQEEINAEDIPF
jgi:hypothetical protein